MLAINGKNSSLPRKEGRKKWKRDNKD